MKIYKRSPHEGFYIYSSCACGEDMAIRMACVELDKTVIELLLSPQEAIEVAECILKVSNDYLNGIETGLDGLDE
jgi:hypothetical protein